MLQVQYMICVLANCRNIADLFVGHEVRVTGYSDRGFV